MKVSYNWLNQYVKHGWSPEELGSAITMAGLELEEIETIGPSLEGIKVGYVLQTRPHPNANRLTLCDVDLGDGEPVQIVCGAPNVAGGQKVPVATIGTTLSLPDRKDPSKQVVVTIQPTTLRGELSNGMICAEDELGLGTDHSGIMILNDHAVVGQSFGEYLAAEGVEAGDAVLDFSITPNRPDATSHFGIARDVAALTGTSLIRPVIEVPTPGGEAVSLASVSIEAPDACRRYVGVLVRGVTIRESPEWLQRRLTAIGLRPRNNVVDVTNFVMYECGQPLHAFDYHQLAGHRIIVRKAVAEEPFTTLDSKERKLPTGTLLICDAERPVAIAGIMGGENSEVTERTNDLLIESAYFDPTTIRRSVKALGLQTDSSYRFERGIDPEGQAWAAMRAAELIVEMAGGEIVQGMIDEHPSPVERRIVNLRLSRIRSILGIEVPVEEVDRILTAIGFTVKRENPLEVIAEQALEGRPIDPGAAELSFRCEVPSFRPDIEREIDVIEEIARLYGYDRISEPVRSATPAAVPPEPATDRVRKKVRDLISGTGYREIYTNSLLRKETADAFLENPRDGESAVETLNPISTEMASLRSSLLPGMLQVMGYNQNHGQQMLRFFELGHVFRRADGLETPIPGYLEHESLILALSGPRQRGAWDLKPVPSDIFDVKGMVETLLERLHLEQIELVPDQIPASLTSFRIEIRAEGYRLGMIARLADNVNARFDLKQPVYYAELNFDALVTVASRHLLPSYRPISRYPVADRDLALVVERAQPVGPIIAAVWDAGGVLLKKVDLFDVYTGEGIDPAKKSVALSMRFSADRTLQDEEVDRCIKSILDRLSRDFKAALR